MGTRSADNDRVERLIAIRKQVYSYLNKRGFGTPAPPGALSPE